MDATIDQPTAQAQPAKLQPKEHGAYAILGVPLVTSILLSGPTAIGICVGIASVAGFLAHEPLLVAWGHRGSRAQRTTPAATNRLGICAAVAIGCGVVAMVAGSAEVRWSLLACAVAAVISFLIAMSGYHRRTGGQLWGVIGLSIPSVPIMLAGGYELTQTLSAWLTWLIGFAATTMAVRGVIAYQKHHSRGIHWALLVLLSLTLIGLAWVEFTLPLAALPMLTMAWYLMLDPPPARHLKRVGWTLVAGTIASAVWMIAAIGGSI